MKKAGLILLGIFLSLAVLELGMRAVGYIRVKKKDYKNRIMPGNKDKCVILCLGESLTDEQYPEYLEKGLNKRNLGIKFRVIDEGKVACTTNYILVNLRYYIEKYKPNIIITMMGINDNLKHNIVFENKKNSINNLRVYRLAKLLILNINNTMGIYNQHNNEEIGKEGNGLDEEAECKKSKGIEKNNEISSDSKLAKYMELGKYYKDRLLLKEAKRYYSKAIEVNPDYEDSYIELGVCYVDQNLLDKAEDNFRKAIKINPNNGIAYLELAFCYRHRGNKKKTRELLEKAVKVEPDNDWICLELSRYYRAEGLYDESMELFEKAIEISREISEKNDPSLADNKRNTELIFKKFEGEKIGWYNPSTIYNYKKLKKIVLNAGIQLVCMQYPMRNIEPLKQLLKPHDGIIFVSNEKIFAEAVDKEGRDVYFRDKFAEDFGHCTIKGNKLIAKNIADVLEREVFKR